MFDIMNKIVLNYRKYFYNGGCYEKEVFCNFYFLD